MTGLARDDAEALSRPLRRDAQRNIERIIEAAGEVFAVRGFAATLDEVAHHAGVGVGTVYRRFPTKEALIDAVFVDRLQVLVDLAELALTAPSGWAGLTEFLRRCAGLNAASRGFRDVALSIGTDHFARVGGRMVPLVEELVARAQTEGSLRPDVNAHDLPIILAIISDLPPPGPHVRPALHERYLQLIVDGLRAGPGTGDLGPMSDQSDVEAVVGEYVPAIRRRS